MRRNNASRRGEAAPDHWGFRMGYDVISAPAVQEFDASFQGQLLRDGDEGYEQARNVWNGMFDRRPALIARCRSVDDVRRGAVSRATTG